MKRKTAHDFDQDLLMLFDAYVHGALDRRGFLEKASKYAVGGVTAAMLLDQLSPKFAEAQVVRTDGSRPCRRAARFVPLNANTPLLLFRRGHRPDHAAFRANNRDPFYGVPSDASKQRLAVIAANLLYF